jgi:DNA-binding GntR family transcriptional regulator
LRDLDNELTEAILTFHEAAKKVSRLQLKVTHFTNPMSIEGQVARHSAILMAFHAGDKDGAVALLRKFCTEEDARREFYNDLLWLFTD